MCQVRLNDAAIVLHYHLTQARIPHGIFGGHAISVLGGLHAAKDIDCLASASKQEVISILNEKSGFAVRNRARWDLVEFLWSEPPGEHDIDRNNPVLVKVVCEMFEDAKYNMSGVRTTIREIQGRCFGKGPCSFLDPFSIFKGKLCAAAARVYRRDINHLRWLVIHYGPTIRERWGELRPLYIGLALRRHPELEHLFGQLGVNLAGGRFFVTGMGTPPAVSEPAIGEIQEGLLL